MLELDQRTVAECARTGQLSRRVRQALERALQKGVGSAAARQRERNERLESRVEALENGHEALEKGYDALGKEVRKRVAAVEGRVEALRRDGAQGTGAGHAGAGPSQAEADGSESGASGMGRKPPPRPRSAATHRTAALARECAQSQRGIRPLIALRRDAARYRQSPHGSAQGCGVL